MENFSAKKKYKAYEKGVFVQQSTGPSDIAAGGSGVRLNHQLHLSLAVCIKHFSPTHPLTLPFYSSHCCDNQYCTSVI